MSLKIHIGAAFPTGGQGGNKQKEIQTLTDSIQRAFRCCDNLQLSSCAAGANKTAVTGWKSFSVLTMLCLLS